MRWPLRPISAETSVVTSLEVGPPSISEQKLQLLTSLSALTLDEKEPTLLSIFLSDNDEVAHLYINDVQSDSQRVLITTHTPHYDNVWGTLGPALLLDRDSGQLLKVLRGSHSAMLPNGNFLLGLEGYDAFDTWLYDEQGNELQQWRSFGPYVIDEQGGIRVVECDGNAPTHSHIAKLHLDGYIERGPALNHGQVPPPLVVEENDLLIFDHGSLRYFNHELQELQSKEIFKCDDQQSNLVLATLSLYDEDTTTNLMTTIYLRDNSISGNYVRHRWQFEWYIT